MGGMLNIGMISQLLSNRQFLLPVRWWVDQEIARLHSSLTFMRYG